MLPFDDVIDPTPIVTPQQRDWQDEQDRRQNHRERILRQLQTGPQLNITLKHISIDYRTRISELRKRGHVIVNTHVGRGVTRYTLARGRK